MFNANLFKKTRLNTHSKTVYIKRLMIIFIAITTNPLDRGLNSNYEIQDMKVLGIWNIFPPFVIRNCIIKNNINI